MSNWFLHTEYSQHSPRLLWFSAEDLMCRPEQEYYAHDVICHGCMEKVENHCSHATFLENLSPFQSLFSVRNIQGHSQESRVWVTSGSIYALRQVTDNLRDFSLLINGLRVGWKIGHFLLQYKILNKFKFPSHFPLFNSYCSKEDNIQNSTEM